MMLQAIIQIKTLLPDSNHSWFYLWKTESELSLWADFRGARLKINVFHCRVSYESK